MRSRSLQFAWPLMVALCAGVVTAMISHRGSAHDFGADTKLIGADNNENNCDPGMCCKNGGRGAGGKGGGGSGTGAGGDFLKKLAGDPIWLPDGSMQINATDLSTGVVFPIHLTRRYDGKSTFDTALGYAWAFDHDQRMFEYPDGSLLMRSGCGRRDRFVGTGGGFVTPTDGIRGTLSQLANGTYVFVRSDAERSYFDADGRLTAIENREGHRHEFTYDARGALPLIGTSTRSVDPTQPMVVAYQPRLTRIAERTADGQLTGAWIDFFYEETSGRLTHILTDDGRRIDYAHDAVHGNLTGVSGLDTYQQSFSYADPNNPHLLTTFVPATGVAPVVNVYDTQGRVTTQTIGDQVITIAYPTETTRTVSWVVKDPAGAAIHTRQHSFQFQGTDLVKETNALGHELRRVYTPNRDLEREELWQRDVGNGSLTLLKATNWTYDGQGRPLTESVTLDSGEVVTTTKTYDHGWVASVETTSSLSSQVFRTEYTFDRDADGVPVNIHEMKRRRDDGVFAVTTYAYCSAADTANAAAQCPYERLLKSVDGPRTDVTDVTTYAYYTATDQSGCGSDGPCHRKGDLKRTTNALGQASEVLAYDAAGRPVKTQDASGVVTETTYHIRGWPLTRTVLGDNPASNVDDATSTFIYDARGNVTSQTDADGVVTTYVYDTRDRLAEIQDATGGRLVYTYDSDGNRLSEEVRDVTNVLKRKRSYAYDKLGRRTTERDAQNRATTYEYDAASRQTAVVDALNHRTQHTYDDLGRLTQTVADAMGSIQATTQFTYDAAGNLRSVTDPKGLATSYTYNALGQLTQLQSPDTGTTDYTYDVAGNRLTQTDARGITATHAYDALNRLTAITYADSNYDVGYAYDQADATTGCTDSFETGRLTTMTDETGNTVYCYDRHGNVARKTQTVDGVAMAVGYAYSLANRLSGLTYPSGAAIAYSRDTQGRITGIDRVDGANSVPIVTGATYLPFGPLASLAFDGGATQAWTYDQNYGIDAISGTALNLDYTTDALGNISGLPNTTPANARVYGYDALSRLTSVKDGSNTTLEAFTYDDTGNRLSKQTGVTTQTYGYPATNHRLTSIDSTSRTYDAMGSLEDRGDGWTFEYDPRQRLAVTQNNSSVTQTNRYNGRGERVAKLGAAGTISRFAYNEAGQLLTDRKNTALTEHRQEIVWLDDRPVAVLQHTGAYAAEILHVHSDHLGSPRAVTRPAAANGVIWTWPLAGAAFGEHASVEDPDGDGISLGLNLRYPGQYFDAESGLFYNYFRDYEPAIGRYIESDPIGLAGGTSTYLYVDADPISFMDPKGLSSILMPRPIPLPISPAMPRPYPLPLDPAMPIPLPNEALPKTGDCKVTEWKECESRCDGAVLGCYVSIKWKTRGAPNGNLIRSEERTVNCNCAGTQWASCSASPSKGG